MSGKIVALVNNKGGVGKTTLSVNLSHALANKKYNILTVDTDSQCNTTNLLVDPDFVQTSLYEILSGEIEDISQAIYPTNYGMYCLANAEETSALEFDLSKNLPENYKLIRNYLREYAQNNYDYTLIDCPPNLGFFVINALFAADFVIVPILCGSSFSLEGLSRAISLVNEIKESGNPDLRFLRLLINNVDKRTAMSKIITDQLVKNFGEQEIFDTKIGTSTVFQQAEYLNKTVLRHAPRSPGAKSYRSLAKEFCNIIENSEE